MLTKMLTSSALRFYGFEDGVPVERWHAGPSSSSWFAPWSSGSIKRTF